MRLPGGRSGTVLALLAASGCSLVDEFAGPGACVAPVISQATVANDTTNVLSAFVTIDVHLADSVTVRFGTTATLDSTTPAFAVNGDTARALILGLQPTSSYDAQVMAFNRCANTKSDVLRFATSAPPSDLPAYTAEGSAPAPGYVVFGAGKYGLVIDNSGRVVWYHRFSNGPGLNFQPQPDGRFGARPPTEPGGVASWVEIAPDGITTRTLGCAHGFPPRMHDAIAQPDGSYWLLCDETRTIDLSAQGGPSQARVLGTGVQHRSASGDVLFEWSPFDHLEIDLSILDPVDRNAPIINWTHGNALDLDSDGNLLVSFRNLNEVTKIDTRTGAVIWRMGGARNQMTFENVDMPVFMHQHGLRAIGGGAVQLLDNLGDARGSRAERYQVDGARRTVRLSASFGSSAGIIAQIGGNTQMLGDGHTLVSFGNGGGVEEYDTAGNVVWRLTGNPGYVFRAQRIRSLYKPGVGDPR